LKEYPGTLAKKRLKGAFFLDVAKAFDIVWIYGLIYKLTLLKFQSYVVNTVLSYLRGRTFEASFQTATASRRDTWASVTEVGLNSLVLFSLYVKDMSLPSYKVELPLYGEGTAIITTFRKPTLLVNNLET